MLANQMQTSGPNLANFARHGASTRWLLAMLLIAVLGFSLSMATHEYDSASHPANEHCLTCDLLHAGGHGVLAAAIQIFAPHGLLLAATTPSAIVLNLSVHAYGARAPPFSAR